METRVETLSEEGGYWSTVYFSRGKRIKTANRIADKLKGNYFAVMVTVFEDHDPQPIYQVTYFEDGETIKQF